MVTARGDEGIGTEQRLGEIVIAARFNGPEASANGGYACGALARFIREPAEVTLRMPPPLEQPLEVRVAAGEEYVRLYAGDALVAEGRSVDRVDAEPPVKPEFEEAVAACALHPWRGVRHPLSDCFVCGPERGAAGDGLGISPGPLARRDSIASAPFVPDDSVAEDGVVRPEVVWAALDCPSYPPTKWGNDRIALLGRLAAQREREIQVGERLVAIGWSREAEGRKHQTASALIDARGEVAARATATWIELRS